MMALTIWQPWASLIMAGVKPYEFRGWPAPLRYRGCRIAIHAGARPMVPGEIEDLIARLVDPERAWSTALKRDALPLLDHWLSELLAPWPRRFADDGPRSLPPLGCVLGTAVLGEPRRGLEVATELGWLPENDSDRDQHSNWAWPLSDVRVLEPPVPARGSQGFWVWREPGGWA